MRSVFVIGLCVAACAEEPTLFGDPGVGKSLELPGARGSGSGGVSATDLFGAAYDPARPPPFTDTGANIHQTRAGIPITNDSVCLTCHGVGQAGATSKWAYAGVALSGGTTPLSEGEIIVVDGTTKLGPVKTTIDGYFWFSADGGTVGPTARTAIRNRDGGTSEMVQVLDGNGSCNAGGTCHTGAAGRIDFR